MSRAGAALEDAPVDGLPRVELLGVGVMNASLREALTLMERWVAPGDARSRSIFIVNAHTLNLAWEDRSYRAILNAADAVFGDGSGVRLAAGLRGERMRANLVGTDLLPRFFHRSRAKGCRCFLLGATDVTVTRAARHLESDFPGIAIVGTHHGYVDDAGSRAVVDAIHQAAPDMLLVGMGNPLQERWIHDHLPLLRVPVSIGVGGLFDHWAGNLRRAPGWVRRLGLEWLQILLQQPRKWRRYLLGNPQFVVRAMRSARSQ